MKPKLGFGAVQSDSPPSQLNQVFQLLPSFLLLPSFEQVPGFCQIDFHSSQLQESDQAAFAAAPTEKTQNKQISSQVHNLRSLIFFFFKFKTSSSV